MSKLPNNQIRMRLAVAGVLLTLVGFGMVVRQLYKIQLVEGDFYQKKAMAQQLRTTSISANRGSIYDRNGNILAVSDTVWTVLFSPADITDKEAELLADGMSEILGVERQFVIDKAKNKKNFYQVVKRKVDKETADKVLEFADKNQIKGVSLEEDSKRSYPYNSLASSILGFVNTENTGAYGMEAYYNTTLSGTPGRRVSAKNAWGTDMPFRYENTYDPQDGNSIVTTLDATVQQIIERHLRTAVLEHGVKKRAASVFMDITTGEVLGMVTMPDFDPNNPNEIADPKKKAEVDALKPEPLPEGASEEQKAAYAEADKAYNQALLQAQFEQWNNKCITEPYEPGSVFKIVTLSAGLETGAVGMNSHFYCPGYHMVGSVRKSCWKTAGHGAQDLAAAVRNSCNPAFMMIGSAIGAEQFYNYFEAFGLTTPTGIALPGEATGVYHSKKALMNPNDYENSLTSCSFGQTFKITPIQLISAVSAACNGGYLYEPMLVKQVVDRQGNIVSQEQPKLRRQVISEETSRQVCQILETVVTEGSGRNAYIPGYRIGGKTGTSEKIDQMKVDTVKQYILSFVGVAPMDDPNYACLVLLDEPTLQGAAYGSTIAAPIVGSIFNETLPYLGVEKVFNEREAAVADRTLANYVGYGPHDAQYRITAQNLNSRIIGTGSKVVSQVPRAGTEIPQGGTVLLYTDEGGAEDTVVVPDVRSKTGLTANRLILNAGLNLKVTGVGVDNSYAVAARQDTPPGTRVPKGTVITVDFTDTSQSTFDRPVQNVLTPDGEQPKETPPADQTETEGEE